MAKFVFRMEQMLNIKRQLEESIKNELAAAIRRLEDEKQKLKSIEKHKKEIVLQVKESMLSGISIQKLREYNAYISSVENKIINQKKVVNDSQKVADKIRERLVQIMKERKVLETLREKKYEEFKQAELKKEELILGEVASYKYIERKVGEEDGNHRTSEG